MKVYFATSKLLALGFICAISFSDARADEKLKVVATLPTFAALVQEVGGSAVEVSSVASPRFNPHFIEPKPSDVLRIKRADLFVHSGLDLEVWREPLLNAVGKPEFRGSGRGQLDLSEGIQLLKVPASPVSRSQGDIHQFGNPHFWIGPQNGAIMVERIAAKLSELDPSRSSTYHSRAQEFNRVLVAKIEAWKKKGLAINGKNVAGYHDEWAYLMEFLGLRMEHFLEPKPGIPPSPQHLRGLKSDISSKGIAAIIQSTYVARESADNLGKETGTPVLLLCQSVGELPQCSDYLSMMQYNIESIIAAIQ